MRGGAKFGGGSVTSNRDSSLTTRVARCAPELMGHMRPVGYLFLVADCALRSACSAHAIHAPAISINIALSFSDTRCAKRRHAAAYRPEPNTQICDTVFGENSPHSA